ncbi:MAG: hypothetical protein RTV31_04065 [Candidatus Thorarchaeota archaeon]
MRKLSCILLVLLLATILVTPLGISFTSMVSNQIPVSAIQSEDPPNSNITWSARTQQIPQLVENNSIAAGDHVIVNGTFSPSLNVTECELNIWNGFTFTSNRSIIPVSDPEASFEEYIIYDDFDWVVIKGIERGLTVNITCNFTSANCDFMAWIGSMNSSLYSYSKSIVDMSAGDRPEQDSFIWEWANDTMVLGCLNTANSSTGSWTAIVQIGVNSTTSCSGSTISLDTYYLESRNQTYNIKLTGTTDTYDTLTIQRDNVTLCNFFAPVVTVNAPYEIGVDTDFWNLSWSCSDMNRDDVNFFSVWISHDSGVTFIYLYDNTTATTFIWDTTSWLDTNFIVRVIAYSCDITSAKCGFDNPPDSYWPGDFSTSFSTLFAPTGPPPSITLIVDSVNDISYEYLSTGNTVDITLHFSYATPSSLEYIVRDNGSIWFEDTIDIESLIMTFQLDIDGLIIGSHDIEVDFPMFNQMISFTVNVVETSQLQLIIFSLSVGTIGCVLAIVMFAIYKKRT